MANRSKRKGGMKAKRRCPKCEETKMDETHNSPDWYMKDVIPQVGSNFSVLTTLDPEPRLLQNGMYVNALVEHECILAPPVDQHSSFHYKMVELYTQLREVNAGAANYNAVKLGAYCYNIMVMRALVAHIRRGLAAVRHANALYRESPKIFIAAAGYNNYDVESAAYAQNYNDFVLLCKDLEQLPIPPFSLMDRYEFLFDKVFVDSQTTRPAMVSFVPLEYITLAEASGSYVCTSNRIYEATNANATIASNITAVRAILGTLLNDAIVAIIRGDMIKAFGASAMRRNLVSQVDNHFSMGYSPDVMSQLENAAIVGLTGNSTVVISTTGGPATITTSRGNAHSAYILDETRRIINFHGEQAPRDGELLAITRLAVTGTNGSTVEIDSASGVVIRYTSFLHLSSGATASVAGIPSAIGDTHSSIQSTAEAAYRALATLPALVDHFPMILHHPSETMGAILDVDNAAYMDVDTLRDVTELANRSLLEANIPRGDNGKYLR